jgi:hypothetical protein
MIQNASLRLFIFCAALSSVCIAGCGGGNNKKTPKLVPVSGKVTLGGQPLTAGVVTFFPDESKGNKGEYSATGSIDADGNYKLTTDGKEGAPLGAYRVSVNTQGMPGSAAKESADGTKTSTPPTGYTATTINTKYLTPTTSGLTFEVVENAGAGTYDIKLTK